MDEQEVRLECLRLAQKQLVGRAPEDVAPLALIWLGFIQDGVIKPSPASGYAEGEPS